MHAVQTHAHTHTHTRTRTLTNRLSLHACRGQCIELLPLLLQAAVQVQFASNWAPLPPQQLLCHFERFKLDRV